MKLSVKTPLFTFGYFCLALFSYCQQPTSDKGYSYSKKINGLSFVASPKQITANEMISVKKVNAKWVSLMPFAFMKNMDSPMIRYNNERQWRGERIEGIKETAIAFKAEGISVMLKPQIWIGRGAFTGHIKMKTEENWKILEQQYEDFILDFAKVAEEMNCEIFCIGTELNSFVVARPVYWDSLIAKIKLVYKGKLTYAENWDTYTNVPFWNTLDYIGVDAYFPVSGEKIVSKKELEKGWEIHKREIKSLAKKTNKPVLFTEFGYRSCDYTAKEPWANSKEPPNMKNQTLALEVLFNNFWKEKWFAGGFLWKWYDHELAGGEGNTDYTPQNKPAEKLINKMYEKY